LAAHILRIAHFSENIAPCCFQITCDSIVQRRLIFSSVTSLISFLWSFYQAAWILLVRGLKEKSMHRKSKRMFIGAMAAMTFGSLTIPFGVAAGTSASIIEAPSRLVQYAQDDHEQVQEHSEQDVTKSTTANTDTPALTEKQHEEHETTQTDHQEVGMDGTFRKTHRKTKHVVKKEQTQLDGSSSTENHNQEDQQTTTDQSSQN
jgi:hypothetical protein